MRGSALVPASIRTQPDCRSNLEHSDYVSRIVFNQLRKLRHEHRQSPTRKRPHLKRPREQMMSPRITSGNEVLAQD
jgi:hypothetical protein